MPSPSLESLQRLTLSAILRPLTPDDGMQPQWTDGSDMHAHAATFIKPNDRLTSFERLEIYNRQYWFRLLELLHEDHPGLRAILGDTTFESLIRAYLTKYPSRTFALRDLADRLPQFITECPDLIPAPRRKMALDMARFERAQTLAFDERSETPLKESDLLGQDPATLRLALQPHITLLALDYPLDKFSLRLRTNALRADASNAADMTRRKPRKPKPVPLPKKQKTFVAVHRYDNALYYKRLPPVAHALLTNLQKGHPLEQAITDSFATTQTPPIPATLRKWFTEWTSLGWFHLPRPA